MLYLKHFGGLLLILIMLASCGSNIKDSGSIFTSFLPSPTKLVDYKKVEMEETDIRPTDEELSDRKVRVVILPPSEKSLKKVIVSEIVKYLEGADIDILIRSGGTSLDKEQKLAELLSSAGRHRGLKPADYVVEVFVDVAELDSDVSRISNRCTYSATVSGLMKIHSLSEEAAVKHIHWRDSFSENKNETTCSDIPTDFANQLRRKATETAIEDERTELQNSFSIKGYITERRVHKQDSSKSLFKIDLGTDKGLEDGKDLVIYTNNKVRDDLSGKYRVERHEAANGEITKPIGPNYAWLSVDDPNEAEQVRLGDFIIVKYKGSIAWDTTVERFGDKVERSFWNGLQLKVDNLIRNFVD